MSIAEILLVACVLILVWRVWRLEGKAEAGVRAERSLDDVFLPARVKTRSGETIRAFVATANEVGEVRVELHSLARALGYEWKRTEAKEGWERKNPFYGSPFFKCDPFAGIDLSGHYVAPKPPTNRPTKKPTTRTAAKRGPQRRATH